MVLIIQCAHGLLLLLLLPLLPVASSAEECGNTETCPATPSATGTTWALKLGVEIQGVEIHHEIVRGIRATEPLVKGTQLIRVPRSLLITEHLALKTPLGTELLQLAHEQAAAEPPYDWKGLVLVAWLLHEQSLQDPQWRDFLESLPPWSEFQGHPSLLSQAEAASCLASNSSAAFKDFLRKQRQYERELALLVQLPSWRSRRHSREDFLWARLVVNTRSFTVPSLAVDMDAHMDNSGRSKSMRVLPLAQGKLRSAAVMLAPFADMLNHGLRTNAVWSYGNGGFVISADRDIPEGAEILLSYGDKSGQALLTEYGFVTPLSLHDRLDVLISREGREYHLELTLKPLGVREFQDLLSFARGPGDSTALSLLHSAGESTALLEREREIAALSLLHDSVKNATSLGLAEGKEGANRSGCVAFHQNRARLAGILLSFAERGLSLLAGERLQAGTGEEGVPELLADFYLRSWLLDSGSLLLQEDLRTAALQAVSAKTAGQIYMLALDDE